MNKHLNFCGYHAKGFCQFVHSPLWIKLKISHPSKYKKNKMINIVELKSRNQFIKKIFKIHQQFFCLISRIVPRGRKTEQAHKNKACKLNDAIVSSVKKVSLVGHLTIFLFPIHHESVLNQIKMFHSHPSCFVFSLI